MDVLSPIVLQDTISACRDPSQQAARLLYGHKQWPKKVHDSMTDNWVEGMTKDFADHPDAFKLCHILTRNGKGTKQVKLTLIKNYY